jgi:CheY-like chemotaxis protein
VILDLQLPRVQDGLDLIREFRRIAPEVRIIVLSGWTADLDGRAEKEMVDEVLTKPVRSQRLLRSLARGA